MSSNPVDTTCTNSSCNKPATMICTYCRDPSTVYCSEQCQQDDWKSHGNFCGKGLKAYTFDLTLLGSSDPVIKRTFEVPAWFTFRQLHYSLQYAMGWESSHLHEFIFYKPVVPHPRMGTHYPHNHERLRIIPKVLSEEEDDGEAFEATPSRMQDKVTLRDAFDPSGKFYKVVAPQGEVSPLVYTYDLGDNWEHELIFRGENIARANRPLFSVAQGRGPIDDCGGVSGWNGLKSIYRIPAESRTPGQQSRLTWADEGVGRYNPCEEPDLKQMNDQEQWMHIVEHFIDGSDSEDEY